ncbi:hypothetical protein GPECTOR_75g765 [Gonium pectorale]|uniref:Acyltransferase n=1 Tax=Gonium pectorale TaxID=33097 RepID=A0A150G2M4_GONPE|nr:hypothetical protein GPECTOR_75g765 [Gonium pectorale]|eukprot:KXZ44041.1 hypothetical protein GPECTOR_75g765 [Gonium pectorale]
MRGASATLVSAASVLQDKVNRDAFAARMVCTWFLLTAIAQLWLWPLFVAGLWYAKNVWLTAAFLGWSVWRVMASYFPASLVKTAELDPAGHYLFAVHPHGIIAISTWLSFVTDATGFSRAFPGVDPRAATLESNFRLPLLREYLLLHGMCGAARDSLRRVLTGRPGRSVVLVVGGAAEALLAAPGSYDLVLRSRKGFVRLALETGASLVPVIAFGETDDFHTYIPPPNSTASKVIKAIRRWSRVSTPLCWGVGLFSGRGMLPLQTPLITVVGKPVPVERVAAPSPDQVDELHRRYTQELLQLWAENREKYGKGVRREMTVVQ